MFCLPTCRPHRTRAVQLEERARHALLEATLSSEDDLCIHPEGRGIVLSYKLSVFGDSSFRVWLVTARVTSSTGIAPIMVMPPIRSRKLM